MIVSCDKCSATLQLEASKVPEGKFSVRCPRCQNMIAVQGRAKSAGLGFPTPPAAPPAGQKIEFSQPAPAFQSGNAPAETAPDSNEMMKLLGSLMMRRSSDTNNNDFEIGQILLCLKPDGRENLARMLAESGYRVFIADTPTQALERMRDSEMLVVVFAPTFAPELGGAALIQQHVNSMVSLDRRRIFLVSLEDHAQTFNTHEAFVRNFNLVIGSNDTQNLPVILNRALRDYRELYRYFFKGLKQTFA